MSGLRAPVPAVRDGAEPTPRVGDGSRWPPRGRAGQGAAGAGLGAPSVGALQLLCGDAGSANSRPCAGTAAAEGEGLIGGTVGITITATVIVIEGTGHPQRKTRHWLAHRCPSNAPSGTN